MISSLTVNERQVALLTLGVLAAVGLAMAIGGRGEPLGVHGFIVLVSSICLAFPILARLFDPEPPSSRLQEYYDDPTRIGIVLTMIWAVIGMAAGVWVAALLAWPDLTFDVAWTSFGRLRPVHTTASSSASAATR
jgi:cytochrome c oxidase cbb3-type subunit 1